MGEDDLGNPSGTLHQCWRRISSPRHALLNRARSKLGDGFRTLKRGLWWIIFKVMDGAIFFVGSVQLMTGIQLFSGHGNSLMRKDY